MACQALSAGDGGSAKLWRRTSLDGACTSSTSPSRLQLTMRCRSRSMSRSLRSMSRSFSRSMARSTARSSRSGLAFSWSLEPGKLPEHGGGPRVCKNLSNTIDVNEAATPRCRCVNVEGKHFSSVERCSSLLAVHCLYWMLLLLAFIFSVAPAMCFAGGFAGNICRSLSGRCYCCSVFHGCR